MHILVTGGAGFVGGHLVRALLERGHRVRVLDNFSTGKRERLEGLDLEVAEGDITTTVTVAKAMEGVDAVIHLAAIASVMRSLAAPLECHHTNATGTLLALTEARRAGVERFLLASSCAVYGHADGACREDQPTGPLSPYAASKLAGEGYLRSAAECRGMKTLSLRFFNIFGPGQDPDGEYAAVLPKFIELVADRKAPTIFGDGEQTRDFIYVGDVIDAILKGLEFDDARGQVMNIGSGRATSVNQLLAAINDVALTPQRAVHKDARAGEIVHSRADASLAKSLLGWEAQTSLSEGIGKMMKEEPK